MCTAGLIWYTLKVHIWNPKNRQDEIDMLIWVNPELLTWNYINVMQIILFLLYKTKLEYTCARSIYWKFIFDTYIYTSEYGFGSFLIIIFMRYWHEFHCMFELVSLVAHALCQGLIYEIIKNV